MDDYEYLYLTHHEPATCGTCRARRGEAMVCAICQTPFTPEGPTMLFYTSRETPHHIGTIHARCEDGTSDEAFIRY
jgi:hypothetical protein